MPGNDRLRIFCARPPRRIAPLRVALLAALLPGVASSGPVDAPAGSPAAAALRELLAEPAAPEPVIAGVALSARALLRAFYAGRGFEPAWDPAGRRGELLALIDGAGAHGLDPADFFPDRLRALEAAGVQDPRDRAQLDLLLSEALVRYGYQRRFGKVDPRSLEPAWNYARGFVTGKAPEALLAEALVAPALGAFIEASLPQAPWYAPLQRALAQYRQIADSGGWPDVPPGVLLRPGERDARVPALRARLAVEGYLPGTTASTDGDLYDAALAEAVAAFQERHALAVDGVVGTATVGALNVPAGERVQQLRLSLERVRWLSGALPGTYVVVNVAGFRVVFVREGAVVWSSRVVVGRAARQTPIFRGLMTYVELNPGWTLPPTIVREDVLPLVRRDPAYLLRENITVLDRSGRRLDPLAVDWAAAGVHTYTLRQEPGPDNALGRIKLMFPNRHAVYLHDTPATRLFETPERGFSSGCIRVEDPLTLAEWVLDSPQWRRADLEAAIATGVTRRVDLGQPVPVLMVYLTAVADADGRARFYRDLYGRDPPLAAALAGPPRLALPAVARGPGPSSL
jgi:murein L,D-transpeptidase YcbB/YkuD